jgi:hypothetical protein
MVKLNGKIMQNTWLNRVGIILTFLAGFCVAPELIGLNRLKRWEQNLKKRAEALTQKS